MLELELKSDGLYCQSICLKRKSAAPSTGQGTTFIRAC